MIAHQRLPCGADMSPFSRAVVSGNQGGGSERNTSLAAWTRSISTVSQRRVCGRGESLESSFREFSGVAQTAVQLPATCSPDSRSDVSRGWIGAIEQKVRTAGERSWTDEQVGGTRVPKDRFRELALPALPIPLLGKS